MSDITLLQQRHKNLIYREASNLANDIYNNACEAGRGYFSNEYAQISARDEFHNQLRSAIYTKLLSECDKAVEEFLINYLRTACEKLEKEHGTPQR